MPEQRRGNRGPNRRGGGPQGGMGPGFNSRPGVPRRPGGSYPGDPFSSGPRRTPRPAPGVVSHRRPLPPPEPMIERRPPQPPPRRVPAGGGSLLGDIIGAAIIGKAITDAAKSDDEQTTSSSGTYSQDTQQSRERVYSTCPNCGAPNNGNRFCAYCGSSLVYYDEN